MALDNLEEYLGALIDIDGSRYRLTALEGPDALLADPDGEDGGPFLRVPVDEVAEAMVQIVRYNPRSQSCSPSSLPPLSY